MKVSVKFNKPGRWQDRIQDPQFEVEVGDVKKVSSELAALIVESKNGVYHNEPEQPEPAQAAQPEPEPEPVKSNPDDYQIDNIGLGDSLVKKLAANGVTTVSQLVEKTEKEALDMDGIGQAKVEDIMEALEKIGLSLKEDK